MMWNSILKKCGHLPELAEAGELAGSRAILDIAKIARDKQRDQVETNPRHSDDDFRRDVRYQLGYMAALNDILGLPMLARAYIQNLPDNSEV